MRNLRGVISAVIAISTGILVLVGYFIEIPIFINLRGILLGWAVTLAAAALFVGIINMLMVHGAKVKAKQQGSIYSLILMVSMVVTLALGLVLGTDHEVVNLLFTSIQLPVEATLLGLLTISLAYASIRLLRRRMNLLSIVFIVTALFILLGTVPLPFGEIPSLGDTIRPFFSQVLAAGGARGILIGVALGALMTGLRVLFGADRPYGSK
jgi:hypothetical protein